MRRKSKLTEAHKPCPRCKSSDAFSEYSDGHGYCFSCKKYFKPDGEETIEAPINATYKIVPHRSISYQTFEFYGVYVEHVDDKPTRVPFVYPNKAVKFRDFEKKEFSSLGPMAEAGCFGVDKFDAGSRQSITIVEGEYDALAAYEITNGSSAVISVRSASSAKRDCTKDYDFINSFGRIILAFDGDEPGQSAARSVASLFDFNKVYHLRLGKHKDANAYLEAGDAFEFLEAWKNARRYSPDNIINTYAQFANSLVQAKEDILATYPLEGLTNRLYGLARGELVVFKGLEGIGKTEIFRMIEHHVLSTTKSKVGILHLEEDNGTTLRALAGYHRRVPATLPDCGFSDDDVLTAIKDLTGGVEDRIHIHQSFNIEDEDEIVDNIRFLVSAAGCDFIFLDHISWLATGQTDDDERKKLDRLSQRFKLLAKELKFCMLMISHVNDNGQTRGSRYIAKVANTVIHMDRDINAGDNRTYYTIQKARLGGRTGPAGSAMFNQDTGCLEEYHEPIKVPY